MTKINFIITIAIGLIITIQTSAQKINEPLVKNPEWTQPYPPFRIAGNLYYVGTYDLACYLIVTQKGNILINTGLSASAPLIKENIETLGFKLADTKILLTTQAHYDHVGAMATIKKLTGAKMLADHKDADALANGGSSDYEFGKNGSSFQPIAVDRHLKNRDTVTLGNMKLTILHHPGHTKGSCSFLFDVKDDRKTYKVLIANMPTIITDRKFTEVATYPDISNDYAYTLDAMKTISFDLWVSSHANQCELHTKHKPGDAYNPEAFADRKGYNEAIGNLEAEYQRKVEDK